MAAFERQCSAHLKKSKFSLFSKDFNIARAFRTLAVVSTLLSKTIRDAAKYTHWAVSIIAAFQLDEEANRRCLLQRILQFEPQDFLPRVNGDQTKMLHYYAQEEVEMTCEQGSLGIELVLHLA